MSQSAFVTLSNIKLKAIKDFSISVLFLISRHELDAAMSVRTLLGNYDHFREIFYIFMSFISLKKLKFPILGM